MTMKEKCITCGNAFKQVRADQRFCSKACKQKNYRQKKVIQVYKGTEIKLTFSLSDYNGFIEMYGWDREAFPFVLFCFYRRLIPTNLVGSGFYEAIIDVVSDLDSTRMKEKVFIDFKKKFLSGEFEIVV